MFTADALIEKFRYALDNHWGYIYATAGVTWTQAKQDQKVKYMENKYGSSWKKNSEAKNDNYYNAALYGSKWIGHTVADCSGLFVWAFKQLGGSIYHGSNSIYDRYCTKKGKLTDSLKKTLLPGTAVFTGDEKKHGHIGLYVGGGKCIEASGTQAGVCTSNLSAGKWTYYGELKDVSYSEEAKEQAPAPAPATGSMLPTLKKGSKGQYVTLLQTKLANKGYDLGSYGVDGDFGKATEAAVKKFQKDNGLTADGIVGAKTWAALEQDTKMQYYTVIVSHLSESQAKALAAMYDHAEIEKEVG